MVSALRLYRAVVVSTLDPEGLGRVQLSTLRTTRGASAPVQGWATTADIPLGGAVTAKAAYSPGDAVLYAAERLPFVNAVLICRFGNAAAGVGSTVQPLQMALGQGNEATIVAADGALHVSTSAGQQITLQADGAIHLASTTTISLQATQCTLSSGLLTVDAGMSRFSGVVQCDTLITNAIISASYTPGAGNIS